MIPRLPVLFLALLPLVACGGRTPLEVPGRPTDGGVGPDRPLLDAPFEDAPPVDVPVPVEPSFDMPPPPDLPPPDVPPPDLTMPDLALDVAADTFFDLGPDLAGDVLPPPPEGAVGFLAIQMVFVMPAGMTRPTRLPAVMEELVNDVLTASGFQDVELLVRLDSTEPGATTTVIVCEAQWRPGYDCRPDRPVTVGLAFISDTGVLSTEPLDVAIELVRPSGRTRLTLHDWSARGRLDLGDDWTVAFRASASVAELCRIDHASAGCGATVNLLDVADGPLADCGADGSADLATCQPAADAGHVAPDIATLDGQPAYRLRGAATLRRVALVGQ